MIHEHEVRDTNEALVVDPSTRTITNPNGKKITLVQYDHNSERVTFKIPRYIDDHDMIECDKVEVHYNNVGNGTSSSNRAVNSDMYDIADLIVNPDDDSTLLCTWLISQNATQFNGVVEFKLEFICLGDDDVVDYSWNTRKNDNVIEVAEGLDNSERVAEVHSDIIAQLDGRLTKIEKDGTVTPEQIAQALESYLDKNPVETVTEYPDLENKPSINGVELVGNKTLEDLGIHKGEPFTYIESDRSAALYDLDAGMYLLKGTFYDCLALGNEADFHEPTFVKVAKHGDNAYVEWFSIPENSRNWIEIRPDNTDEGFSADWYTYELPQDAYSKSETDAAIETAIDFAITAYDTEAMALLGEDGDSE